MKYILFLLVLSLISCSKSSDPSEKDQLQGKAFGTYYFIKTTGKNNIDTLRPSIQELIDAINKSMSTYQENSLISRLNRREQLVVDRMFRDVFEKSKDIHARTNGYFDPTVGILVNYYGFGSKSQQNKGLDLDTLRKYVDLSLVELKGDTLIKEHEQIYIDLNSIAKGYAVDQFVKLLREKGYDSFLVDIGGEVYAKGNKPNGKPWKVGIDKPAKENPSKRELSAKIRLKDKAMATSGNYRKYKIDKETGKETVHTINPVTGKAKPSSVLSASVIMNDCMSADAYATALMAMGHEKAIEFIEKESVFEAYLIYTGKDGEEKTYMTAGFEKMLID